MKSKKEGLKIDTWGDNFTYMYMGICLRWTYENQIWREGRNADVIICFKFYRYRLRSFRAVGAKNGSLPLTLTVALTTSIHHRHCDGCRPSRHRVNIDILILYRIGRDRIEKCDIPKTPYGVRKI